MKIIADFCGEQCKDCYPFECKNLNRLVVVKRKVTRHYEKPDLQAIKLLSDSDESDISKLTDSELNSLFDEIVAKIKNEL